MERGICEGMALWINSHREKGDEPVRGVDLMLFPWKGQRARDEEVQAMKNAWALKIMERKAKLGSIC